MAQYKVIGYEGQLSIVPEEDNPNEHFVVAEFESLADATEYVDKYNQGYWESYNHRLEQMLYGQS